MSPALQSLEDALIEERVYHGNHPVLTWNIANCFVEQDPAGNRKFTKAKSTGRIDGAVALAMAMGRATLHNPAPAGMFFVNS
jgi:phage terminase large subunit-like protein